MRLPEKGLFSSKLGCFEWFLVFFILFNTFGASKFERFKSGDAKVSLKFKIDNQRTTLAKSIKLGIIKKLIEYSFKKVQ